jgi:hypothetical protein
MLSVLGPTRTCYISRPSVANEKKLNNIVTWLMLSRSDKISAKFFVPKTFRRVVAARSRVEWLKKIS